MSVVSFPPRGVLGHALAAAEALAVLAGSELEALSGTEAVELLGVLGPMAAQLESVSLAAQRAVRESGVWGLDGSRSAKAFLQRTTGASSVKTGADLKLAERLASVLPLTAAALREGAISVEHARVLSRGACSSEARVAMLADPDKGEAFLLAHTDLAVDAFKVFVDAWKYRVDPDAEDAKRRERSSDYVLDLAETLDGTHIRGFATPEVGQALAAVLKAIIGTLAQDDPRSPARRRHDALGTLCQLGLDSRGLGQSGGVRPQLVVHVDWRTLTGMPGVAGLDPAILQEGRIPIPRTVLDRIACDSEVTRIVFGPTSEVLDVGRTQRTFTGPRRRALDARDGGCRAPGCHAPPKWCEGHHKIPWRLGGDTSVDDGFLLCGHHHPWYHDHAITVTDTPDGGLRFTGPDGHDYGTTYPRQLTLPS